MCYSTQFDNPRFPISFSACVTPVDHPCWDSQWHWNCADLLLLMVCSCPDVSHRRSPGHSWKNNMTLTRHYGCGSVRASQRLGGSGIHLCVRGTYRNIYVALVRKPGKVARQLWFWVSPNEPCRSPTCQHRAQTMFCTILNPYNSCTKSLCGLRVVTRSLLLRRHVSVIMFTDQSGFAGHERMGMHRGSC